MRTVSDFSKEKNYRKYKKSLGIRGRLIIGFAATTLFFLCVIGITLYYIFATKTFTNQVLKIDLPTYDGLLDMNSEISKAQLALQRMIVLNNAKYKDDLTNAWIHLEKQEMIVDGVSKYWTNNRYFEMWGQIKKTLIDLKSVQFKLAQMAGTADKLAAFKVFETEVLPLLIKFRQLLNNDTATSVDTLGMLDLQSKSLEQGAQEIINQLKIIEVVGVVLTIIGVLVALFIAIFTARSILHHINIFRLHSSRIAAGDLTQLISVESFDEVGQLGQDMNTMTNSLATIAREITQACHNMVSTLEEVRHAVDAQSSGASEQASSINEITSSLSEIEKSSMQTMKKAKSLGESAERTREKGQLGLDAVDQSVSGMKEVRDKVQLIAQTILDLSNQTQQVGEITKVVNNLAQQSKMLALNASIEAAKAGEAGKGFAVVAVEVKNLAEQSEQATTQVQKILEDIRHASEKAVMVTEEGTKGVDHGTALVEQTGDIIRNLNDVIYETTIASQQIESAVRQEGAGIEQITTGMNEINQVTSSFVESVKQTTEAMSNLAKIAENLKAYVDTYKL